ncbi:hypothetical protein N0B44_26965 [Roseibacterium beibuensis]|uniref:Mitochondrial inner membrane protein n=1 Tax=[Roseibacterium] beibuensis TaxID=1193142 RepID=A0ABP9LER9_9RHOB|nr:hypothetical protein [Roseibacterium beibuensis]MCS6626568.1 hypothetical protein [Roseibacterium beibuensis]
MTDGTAGQDSVTLAPQEGETLTPGEDSTAIEDAEIVASEAAQTPEAETVDPDSTASEAETLAPEGETPEAETPDAETVTAEGDTPETDETDNTASEGDDTLDAESVAGADFVTDAETAEGRTAEDTVAGEAETTVEETTPPAPAPATVVERRGPGFVPLVIGGIVAAGIGYGASYMGLLPTSGGDEATSQLETLIAQQSEALTALQAQVGDLASASAPEVDLSPVTEQIGALGTRLDETATALENIATRVTTLEERPIFSGDVENDVAAAAAAVTQLEEQLRAQEEEAARIEAERAAAEEAAAQAEAEAQAAIAEAEAQAQAVLATAEAESALGLIRNAIATGDPYAEAIDTIAAATEVPEALAANAETGVPTVEELQDSFPSAARAALPVALRETAGEGTMERVTAFLQGQVGGRSIEPREGNDPDAVLSRAQAAVDRAEFGTALEEIAALPEGAQAEMSGWVAEAETRAAVDAALVTVADALAGSN